MRRFFEINITTALIETITQQLFTLSTQFEDICILDSNTQPDTLPNGFKLVAGIGACATTTDFAGNNSFAKLKRLHDETRDWLFGHLCYDLKNEIEQLDSNNFDGIKFPDMYFFQPRYILIIADNKLRVGYLPKYDNETDVKKMFDDLLKNNMPEKLSLCDVTIRPRITRNEYLERVITLQDHIQRGDIYELNFCQEFFDDDAIIDPVQVHQQFNKISQTPFSAFYKIGEKYLLCASPERFLKKTGNKLVSQPIKGTIRRGETEKADKQLLNELQQSEKDRNENVMIVDLVRNDLSRVAKRGTVNVDELYGVYSFKQVHQMISTVSCELNDDIHWTEALRNTFPMGSMTGAPKVRAMQLAEQYESTKRGLYSGALGYVTPEGDFDFNVVIRSILYNRPKKYLSFMVGGAITAKSEPEREYEECLLKAKAMFEVLEGDRSKTQEARTKMKNEAAV